MVNYIFPSVGSSPKLERRCPHCNRSGGNIHSKIFFRSISDLKVKVITQRRMKCPFCGTTWTLRAEGVGHARQRTERLICIGVFLYMLGLSYRNVQCFLGALACKGSKSSIERDVARLGQKVKALHAEAPPLRVRILGADGTGAKMAGHRAGLLFFVDIASGHLVGVEPVNETDTRRVHHHVRRVMKLVGAQELRTDELGVYDRAADTGQRKICLAHWLKSKCRRAHELFRQFRAAGMLYESETMLELIELLHAYAHQEHLPECVERLVRRFINCRRGLLWKANQLLQHIERTWSQVSRDPADPTNNTTERVIGLTYKIRAKTMRGFKSWDKVLAHPYLSEYLRGREGVCDFRKVI